MELKEYLKILRKNRALFFGVWLTVITVGLVFTSLLPNRFKAEFSIDIAREDGDRQEFEQGEYDQFYRLEADDRFGRTIVQWLGDKSLREDIFALAKENSSEHKDLIVETEFKAQKLANSYIRVTFLTEDLKTIQPVFSGIKQVLGKKVEETNGGINRQGWFKLIFNGPTVSNAAVPFVPLLIGLIGGGFLFSFLGVMMKYYFEE